MIGKLASIRWVIAGKSRLTEARKREKPKTNYKKRVEHMASFNPDLYSLNVINYEMKLMQPLNLMFGFLRLLRPRSLVAVFFVVVLLLKLLVAHFLDRIGVLNLHLVVGV